MEERLAAVQSELLRPLPPIQAHFDGFRSRPSFTFEEAAKDLVRASRAEVSVADILKFDAAELDAVVSSCGDAARDRKKIREDPTVLSRDHIAALLFYTTPFSRNSVFAVMNKELSTRRRLDPFLRMIWLIMQAMKACSPFECRHVFRGMKAALPVGKYFTGRIITWYQFSSCTADISVQHQLLDHQGDRTLFQIELTTRDARNIAPYSFNPDEKEVLLQPNTRFEVTGVVDVGDGLTVINLKELPCRDAILVLDEQSTIVSHTQSQASSSSVTAEPPIKQRRLDSTIQIPRPSPSAISNSELETSKLPVGAAFVTHKSESAGQMEGWRCSACTLMNNSKDRCCSSCRTDRPVGASPQERILSSKSSSFSSLSSAFTGCCRETGGDAAECRFLTVRRNPKALNCLWNQIVFFFLSVFYGLSYSGL